MHDTKLLWPNFSCRHSWWEIKPNVGSSVTVLLLFMTLYWSLQYHSSYNWKYVYLPYCIWSRRNLANFFHAWQASFLKYVLHDNPAILIIYVPCEEDSALLVICCYHLTKYMCCMSSLSKPVLYILFVQIQTSFNS